MKPIELESKEPEKLNQASIKTRVDPTKMNHFMDGTIDMSKQTLQTNNPS